LVTFIAEPAARLGSEADAWPARAKARTVATEALVVVTARHSGRPVAAHTEYVGWIDSYAAPTGRAIGGAVAQAGQTDTSLMREIAVVTDCTIGTDRAGGVLRTVGKRMTCGVAAVLFETECIGRAAIWIGKRRALSRRHLRGSAKPRHTALGCCTWCFRTTGHGVVDAAHEFGVAMLICRALGIVVAPNSTQTIPTKLARWAGTAAIAHKANAVGGSRV